MTVISARVTVRKAPGDNHALEQSANRRRRHEEVRAWLDERVRWETRLEALHQQHAAAHRERSRSDVEDVWGSRTGDPS
jgi:hypothetical protein